MKSKKRNGLRTTTTLALPATVGLQPETEPDEERRKTVYCIKI